MASMSSARACTSDFHRLVGAEALDQLGVRFLEFGAERVGRECGRGEPFGRCARRSQGALRSTVVSVASMSSSSDAI